MVITISEKRKGDQMRCTPVEKVHIERAKAEDLYIIQFCITGQYRKSRDGGFAVTGAFSKAAAEEFRNFTREWTKKHSG